MCKQIDFVKYERFIIPIGMSWLIKNVLNYFSRVVPFRDTGTGINGALTRIRLIDPEARLHLNLYPIFLGPVHNLKKLGDS